MKDFEINKSELIDLGQASVETKGQAYFERDTDGSPLLYAMGIAND